MTNSGGPTRSDRRLLRRELHRSRSVPAVIVLLLVAAAASWLAVECTLALLGREPWLTRPGALLEAGISSVDDGGPWLIGVGALALVVGVWLLLLALSSGRRSRHVLADERLLVVADDGVLASALARTARTSAALGPDRAAAWVSRRQVQVRLAPTAGVDVPVSAVQSALAEQIEQFRVRPALQVRLLPNAPERVA